MLLRRLVAASGRALVVTRCSKGEKRGALNLALRNLVGISAAAGTLLLYEQSAACSKESPRLSLKGNWLKLARNPHRAKG